MELQKKLTDAEKSCEKLNSFISKQQQELQQLRSQLSKKVCNNEVFLLILHVCVCVRVCVWARARLFMIYRFDCCVLEILVRKAVAGNSGDTASFLTFVNFSPTSFNHGFLTHVENVSLYNDQCWAGWPSVHVCQKLYRDFLRHYKCNECLFLHDGSPH